MFAFRSRRILVDSNQEGLLSRHHPSPRRSMFNPAACKDLPVPLEWLGNLRHVTQHLADGTTHTSMQWWRDKARSKGTGKWTGATVFQLHCPVTAREFTSGGIHFFFCLRQQSEKSGCAARTRCQSGLPTGRWAMSACGADSLSH